MADIALTTKEIKPLPGAIVRRYDAGATLTPGAAVYVAADGDIELADADAVGSAQARGLVVADGKGSLSFPAGTRVDVVVQGPVAGFSGMTPGAVAYVSTAAGKMDHTAPAGAGDFPFIAGYAESDVVFHVKPQVIVPTANS